jgi:hypothetical protein
MKWRVPVGAAVVIAIGCLFQVLKKATQPGPTNRSIPVAWINDEKP